MSKMHKISKTSLPPSNGTTPVCLLGSDGTIKAYNHILADGLNNTRGITGRKCREVFNCTTEDARLCPLDKIKAKPGKHSSLFTHGSRIIKETAEPIFDDEGRIVAIVLSFPSHQETYDLSPDLIKLQKLETVAQAAGGIVHDLNNIMTVIDGEMMLLKEKLGDGTFDLENDESLRAIIPTISKGRGLIDQLVRFSRGGTPDKAPTAIGTIIREAVSFSLLGSHVTASTEISNDILPVNTNNEQIFQLVSNLVINARHSMKANENGHVNITAAHLPENESHALDLTPGNYVRISVEDYGQGISPENIQRIFEPFFTTKSDGTGLGLALVKLIVKDLSGRIKVDSTVGKGSTFTVFIPAMNLDDRAQPRRKAGG